MLPMNYFLYLAFKIKTCLCVIALFSVTVLHLSFIKVQGIGAHDEAAENEKTKFVSLDQKKAQGDVIAIFNELVGGYKEDRVRRFSEV